MEKVINTNDIKILSVTASSFPEGIQEAYDKLHSFLPDTPPRKIFGLSRPENGGEIIYRAAAEVLSKGEAELLGCESKILKKGNYISLTVKEFKKNLSAIGKAFKQIMTVQNIDSNGYCVEVYDPDEDGYGTMKTAKKPCSFTKASSEVTLKSCSLENHLPKTSSPNPFTIRFYMPI